MSNTWIWETKKTRFRHGELDSRKRDSQVTKNLTCKAELIKCGLQAERSSIGSASQSSAESKNTSDREQNKRNGRRKDIRETKPRPSLKRHERASYDTEPQSEPGFLVAYSDKLRCFHYIGRCRRKPGRDIKRWTYFGDKQLMEKDYDHFCQHCWKRGEQPEQISELAAQDEDSGSSSTDA